MEKTDQNIWTNEQNREICLHILLEALTDAIHRRCCPHFWIPSINLFADLTTKEVKKLLRKLQEIKANPHHYIEQYELPTWELEERIKEMKNNLESDDDDEDEVWKAIVEQGRRRYDAIV